MCNLNGKGDLKVKLLNLDLFDKWSTPFLWNQFEPTLYIL